MAFVYFWELSEVTQTVPNLTTGSSHLCFNITEKGQMIVPDWYNRILDYTRKHGKNNVFQQK